MLSRTSALRIWVPATLAIAALALTGCSGGNSATAPEAEEGPLQKYMSALWSSEEYTDEKMQEEQRRTEEIVAECMTKEGFEYEPSIPPMMGGSFDTSGPEWGSDNFAKEYGYGVVDWPGREEMENQSTNSEEEWVDPNQKYIESLSASEQEAFYETLQGPGPTEEQMAEMEAGGGYESDWTQEGCYGAARHELQEEQQGAAAAYEDPEFTELFESMNELWTEIYNEEDPSAEMSAIYGDWAECMADAGYSEFPTPGSPVQVLQEEYNQLSMPDGEDGEYQEPSKEAQADFQEREIAVATADVKCQASTDFVERQQKLTFAAEQEFLDQNKTALDALIAKYGTQKKD